MKDDLVFKEVVRVDFVHVHFVHSTLKAVIQLQQHTLRWMLQRFHITFDSDMTLVLYKSVLD